VHLNPVRVVRPYFHPNPKLASRFIAHQARLETKQFDPTQETVFIVWRTNPARQAFCAMAFSRMLDKSMGAVTQGERWDGKRMEKSQMFARWVGRKPRPPNPSSTKSFFSNVSRVTLTKAFFASIMI